MAKSRTSFTPAIGAIVVEHVRAGNYFQTAARAAGIHKSTLYAWLARGEEGDPIFAEWYDAMQEAEALAEIDAVAKVREAGQGWQAHMTFLERRHSERWSRSERAGQGSRERQERPEEAFAGLEEQEAAKAASLRAVTG